MERLEKLLDYNEASQILGLRPATLRTWVSARRIPYVKLGGSVRFVPEQLKDFIEKSMRG
jgi:excisionase family DNA binding protein